MGRKKKEVCDSPDITVILCDPVSRLSAIKLAKERVFTVYGGVIMFGSIG